VLQEIEREDQAWEDSQRRRKATRQASESETPKTDAQPTKIVEQKTEPEKQKSNAPRGFY
jgi:hypothetical protein